MTGGLIALAVTGWLVGVLLALALIRHSRRRRRRATFWTRAVHLGRLTGQHPQAVIEEVYQTAICSGRAPRDVVDDQIRLIEQSMIKQSATRRAKHSARERS